MKNELIHKIVTDVDKPQLKEVHRFVRRTLKDGRKYFIIYSTFRAYDGKIKTRRESWQSYEIAVKKFYNRVNPVL